MNKLTKALLVGVMMALLLALSLPAMAQDAEIPGPGEGEPIITPNFGADVATLNPFLADDGTSTGIISRLYPSLVGIDDDTGGFAPGARGGLATDWTVSEDGLTYTFTLRQDLNWSDGTPVTAQDLVYSYGVLEDESVNLSGSLVSTREAIESLTAIDDYTVEITFATPDCTAIANSATIPVVPAQTFQAAFPNNSDMNESAFNLTAPVTSNVWQFLDFAPGEQVTLVADPNYPDTTGEYVIPEGWIFKNTADQTVQVEQFLAGQLTYMGVPQNRQQELKDMVDSGALQGFETSRSNVRFIGLNTADPANPQPGLDEEGNVVDQGLHPVLGDVRVRQALNYAMDFEAINQAAFFGFGIQMASHILPDSWAYNPDIQPYPYDVEMANSLLEEAGWVDGDGDGIRECQGCLYATEIDPSFEGSPLSFELLTNSGNTSQEALGTILQDQWGEVGFDVAFQAIDFNVLVDTFTAQTFDAVMIFWGFSFPDNPDDTTATHSVTQDLPGNGFNAVSYHNERVEELLDEARDLPGCDQAERAVLYGEVQQILHDESPWIWVGVSTNLLVAQPWVTGWDPKPTALRQGLWNEDSWIVDAP
jgi:peptide/nickel transport system substrate-binding protein